MIYGIIEIGMIGNELFNVVGRVVVFFQSSFFMNCHTCEVIVSLCIVIPAKAGIHPILRPLWKMDELR